MTGPSDILPIPIECLRANTVTDFCLYMRGDSEHGPVLYRDKRLPFTEEVRARLELNNVRHLYIDSREEHLYSRYVEDNLGEILADPTLPVDRKADLVYTTGRSLMKEVMAEPRMGETIPRSKGFVEHMYQFMAKTPTAFSSLMKITSYDYYTYTHSINVFVFSITLAQRTGSYSPDELRELGIGALLHDIGKSQIDPAILNNRGKLSADEWKEMRKHPVIGCRILEEQGGLGEMSMQIVRSHHEKLGGSGYPDAKRGIAIPHWVRISSIADIFDALTTRRSYKNAVGSFLALKTMMNEMIEELDQSLFATFVNMMGKPEG